LENENECNQKRPREHRSTLDQLVAGSLYCSAKSRTAGHHRAALSSGQRVHSHQISGVGDKFFLGEGLERAVPIRFNKVSKVAVNRWKYSDDRTALMVVGCIIDLLANRKLRHRKTPSRIVDAIITAIG
jgi:hypothetical protein